MTGRAETGAMQFGDDWTGIFIRGDDALDYASHVQRALQIGTFTHEFERAALRGLLVLLESCAATKLGPVQTAPSWDEIGRLTLANERLTQERDRMWRELTTIRAAAERATK